jgi:hypothetical protein
LIVLHVALRFGWSSSWCCRSRLLLCSGCFAAIAIVILGWMLCCHVARAVAMPLVLLRPPLSGRCFAAVSVMAPHPRMLCHVDDRRLGRMLCRRATVWRMLCRYYHAGALADALPPRLMLTSSPLQSSLHYWLPMCCLPVLGLAGWGF